MSYQKGLFQIPPDGGGGGATPLNYSTTEQDTGLTWLSSEVIYQKTVSVGALRATAGVTTVAHGITGLDKILDWEAFITDGTTQSLIPRAGNVSTTFIDMYVDDTNMNITQGSFNYSAFNCWVTLFYIKD